MARRDARTKGLGYLVDGRLVVRAVNPATGYIRAECRGDSGRVYTLGYDPWGDEWRCGCPALTKCSHLWALQMVTVAESRVRGAPPATADSESPAKTRAPTPSA